MTDNEIIDQALLEFEGDATDLAYQYENGDISASDWKEEMLAVIIMAYLVMWLFGKGGDALTQQEKETLTTLLAQGGQLPDELLPSGMATGASDLSPSQQAELDALITKWADSLTPDEIAQIEAMVNVQSTFLDTFATELAGLSAAEIIRRAGMYINSSRQALERAKIYGFGDLPAYPCDGTSLCLSNCRCSWEIQASETNIIAYWRLGAADHCKTCVDRSQLWNPYIINLQEVK